MVVGTVGQWQSARRPIIVMSNFDPLNFKYTYIPMDTVGVSRPPRITLAATFTFSLCVCIFV